MRDARVVIGVPLYNNSGNLPEALDSLLSQTYTEAAYVLIDDCSSDGTADIAAGYAERDERVHFETNEQRLGLIGGYVRCFERARELCPSMEYFAWASDHDMWHPRWLAELVRTIDARPEAVLVHSRSVGVDADGVGYHHPPPYDSGGEPDPMQRLRDAWSGAPAGYLVYGLTRVGDLEACGVYRPVREPDRLLITELAVRGQIIEHPEVLYYRRRTDLPDAARQRAACFPDGLPLHMLVWWPVSHAALLGWGIVRGHPGANLLGRVRLALRASWTYVRWGLEVELHRRLRAYGLKRLLKLVGGSKLADASVLRSRAPSVVEEGSK